MKKQRLKIILILLLALLLLTSCVETAMEEDNISSSVYKISSELTSSDPVSKVEYSSDELLEQLKNGDLSNVIFEEYPDQSTYEKFYSNAKNGYAEWIMFDVNEDGVNELVLQDEEQLHNGLKLITAIFSAQTGKITCKYIDEAEMMRGAFLSESGKLMDYYYTYGTFCTDNYTNWKFNQNWEFETISSLIICDIYSMEELGDEWLQENPEMSEVGVYRFITYYEKNEKGELIEKKEEISQEEFEEKFEEWMGMPFSQMPPEWY